jgi:hypothetical protein
VVVVVVDFTTVTVGVRFGVHLFKVWLISAACTSIRTTLCGSSIIFQVLLLLLSPDTEGRPPEMGKQSTLFPLSS